MLFKSVFQIFDVLVLVFVQRGKEKRADEFIVQDHPERNMQHLSGFGQVQQFRQLVIIKLIDIAYCGNVGRGMIDLAHFSITFQRGFVDDAVKHRLVPEVLICNRPPEIRPIAG